MYCDIILVQDKFEFYIPNKSIPKTPEMTTSKIEENSFFLMRFHIIGIAITTVSTISVLGSNERFIVLTVSMPKKTAKAIVTATDTIRPPRAGRILAINVLTGGYFNRFLIHAATTRMMTNDGKTTPIVARSAPRNPPCS